MLHIFAGPIVRRYNASSTLVLPAVRVFALCTRASCSRSENFGVVDLLFLMRPHSRSIFAQDETKDWGLFQYLTSGRHLSVLDFNIKHVLKDRHKMH